MDVTSQVHMGLSIRCADPLRSPCIPWWYPLGSPCIERKGGKVLRCQGAKQDRSADVLRVL